jgi:hypothetical protein
MKRASKSIAPCLLRASYIPTHLTAWRSQMERMRLFRRKWLRYLSLLGITRTRGGLPVLHLPPILLLNRYRSIILSSSNLCHIHPKGMYRSHLSLSKYPDHKDVGYLHALLYLPRSKTLTSTLTEQNGSSSSSWLTPQLQPPWEAPYSFVCLDQSDRSHLLWLTG